METLLMKGKPVADKYREAITKKILQAQERGLQVTLAVLVVGDDPASHVYKNRLIKLITGLGGQAKEIILPAASSEQEILQVIDKLNADPAITGILPMMPLPKPLDSARIGAAVLAAKDVDCLNTSNEGEFFAGRNPWGASTPRACLAILDYYGINPAGKQVVILGRSNVVGKPVALMLLQKNATVTVCHSKTTDLASLTRQADILVAAIGQPAFVKPEMVKEGVVIVDVGINAVGDKLVGDVDPAVMTKSSAFTPVPGGVGVVSNMMVMEALTRGL